MLNRLFALVTLLALLGGALYYCGPPGGRSLGPVGQRIRDTKITGSVRTALALNRHLKPHDLDVTTESGVVTLRGRVPTQSLSDLATRVATAVPDVTQVVNHLQVVAGPPTPESPEARTIGESLDDRSLEMEIRLALSLRRELAGADITVTAFRRQVTLTGELAREAQREVALEAARATPGAGSVKDDLQIRHGSKSGRLGAEQAVRANANLAPYALRMEEEGGRLVLRGQVRTAAEKDLAGLLAREGAGGTVENALQIVPR